MPEQCGCDTCRRADAPSRASVVNLLYSMGDARPCASNSPAKRSAETPSWTAAPIWPLPLSAADAAAPARAPGRCRLGACCCSSDAATPLAIAGPTACTACAATLCCPAAAPQRAPAAPGAPAPAARPSVCALWLAAGRASSSSDGVRSSISCGAAALSLRRAGSGTSDGDGAGALSGCGGAARQPGRQGAGAGISSTMMASSAERNPSRSLQGHHTLSRALRSAATAAACTFLHVVVWRYTAATAPGLQAWVCLPRMDSYAHSLERGMRRSAANAQQHPVPNPNMLACAQTSRQRAHMQVAAASGRAWAGGRLAAVPPSRRGPPPISVCVCARAAAACIARRDLHAGAGWMASADVAGASWMASADGECLRMLALGDTECPSSTC